MIQGIYYFSLGQLDPNLLRNFIVADNQAFKSLNQTKDFLSITLIFLKNITKAYPEFKNITYW